MEKRPMIIRVKRKRDEVPDEAICKTISILCSRSFPPLPFLFPLAFPRIVSNIQVSALPTPPAVLLSVIGSAESRAKAKKASVRDLRTGMGSVTLDEERPLPKGLWPALTYPLTTHLFYLAVLVSCTLSQPVFRLVGTRDTSEAFTSQHVLVRSSLS
jgi:hypothetical protein